METFLLMYGLRVYSFVVFPNSYPEINPPGCGKNIPATRIVNGTIAREGQFPWMVLLRMSYPQLHRPATCGATIITAQHLLTAGHCTQLNGANTTKITASYGTLLRVGGTTVRVSKYLRHPRFVEKFYFNDIAILLLERPIKFGTDVGPICIPTGPIDVMGKEVDVAGWGRIKQNGTSSRVLRHTALKILPTGRCEKIYKKLRYKKETMLCAYKPLTDTCTGDSGGPMMIRNTSDSRVIQVAIVSYGDECARKDFPAVYTRLDTYVHWIKKNIGRYELYKTIPS